MIRRRAALSAMVCFSAIGSPVQADVLGPGKDLHLEVQSALADFDAALGRRQEQPEDARRQFQAIARRLESVVSVVPSSGKLEYNLANAYLMAGDIGRAIVHYRRALRLIPRDPLVNENLSVARNRCLTQIKPSDQWQALSGLLAWHYKLSRSEKLWLALLLYVLAWMSLTARLWIKASSMTGTAIVAGLLAAMLGGSYAAHAWLERNRPDGVVTALDVGLYRGPSVNETRVFEQPLQPGVELTLLEKRADWWKVRLPDGNSGWLKSNAVELVTPDARESIAVGRQPV